MSMAIIDGDLLPYEMGGLKNEEGEDAGLALCWGAVQERINQIQRATKAEEVVVYLSCQVEKTTRYEDYKIMPYKGQRVSPRPIHWGALRKLIDDTYLTRIARGMEADDLLGIDHCENTILCSRDKDLLNIPGKHYQWPVRGNKDKGVFTVDILEANRSFCKQLLTGDTVDNILGLRGVGGKSNLLKKIDECKYIAEMLEYVFSLYFGYFGLGAYMYLRDNIKALYIYRGEADIKEPFPLLLLPGIVKDFESSKLPPSDGGWKWLEYA